MLKVCIYVAVLLLAVFAIMSITAGLLSYFVGQVSPTFGLPVLDWWKSFCILWIVSIIGSAFGVSHAAASKNSK